MINFKEEVRILDQQTIHQTLELMHQMVRRYLMLNIPCQMLKFYAPSYFVDELTFNYAPYSFFKEVEIKNGRLSVWGAEVQIGYENKVILFSPSHIPAMQTPVMEISRFGMSNMAIVARP